jgi:hypothetical protein
MAIDDVSGFFLLQIYNKSNAACDMAVKGISLHANFLIIFLYDGFFLIFKVQEIVFYILD